LEAGAVDASLPFIGAAEPVDLALPAANAAVAGRVRDLGLEAVDAQQVSLEEADFIVSAGNGVQNVDTFAAMANAFGAVIGASRVAVDEGRFTRDKQVGATGKTVTATTYIAVGISGAVQHLQGIKDCRHVIAINRDAGAPIVKRADLTLIGDAEAIMQAVLAGAAAAPGASAATKEQAA
jgi:electron transfer flavoprotein alpha subunit